MNKLTSKRIKMNIEPIKLSDLKNDELSNIADQLGNSLNEADIVTLGLDQIKGRFDGCNEKYKELINPLLGSKLTMSLSQADNERDDVSIFLYSYTKSHCHSPVEAERQAAELILKHFSAQDYPFTRLSYAVQSSKTNSLLYSFETDPDAKKALETLSATRIVGFLKRKAGAFEGLVHQRNHEQALRESGAGLESRKELQQSITDICNFVELMNRVNPQEGYAELIRKFNQIIGEFKSELKARHTRKENAESKIDEVSQN